MRQEKIILVGYRTYCEMYVAIFLLSNQTAKEANTPTATRETAMTATYLICKPEWIKQKGVFPFMWFFLMYKAYIIRDNFLFYMDIFNGHLIKNCSLEKRLSSNIVKIKNKFKKKPLWSAIWLAKTFKCHFLNPISFVWVSNCYIYYKLFIW